MRLRKAKGKNKACITLTESEIMQACREFLVKKGYSLSNVSYLKIPLSDKVDSLGRRRKPGIEYLTHIED
jgi:hypothetical protein